MPFEYSCFISYCHGEHPLMMNFINQIQSIFENCFEPYFNQKVFIDKSRLKPGYKFNEVLSRAICHSISFVVIYIPRYETHSYCLREYLAMERLQERRLGFLENKSVNTGMIIPIIFRDRNSSNGIISKIKNEIHYCDFSDFSLTNMKIIDYPECVKKIEDTAKEVYNLYQLFEECDSDPCGECNSFLLPSEDEVKMWINSYKYPFPWK